MSASQDTQPFIVYQADFRVFTVDADGDPLARQFIGGSADEIEMSGEFVPRRVQYHGRARATEYHEDEMWSITVGNVRAVDYSGTAAPPRQVRNRELAIVVVWFDGELGLWVKRCYLGVKEQPAHIEKRHLQQTLRYSAEEMREIAGTGAKPDFSLIRQGEVFYIGEEGEQILLYTYDPATRTFTEVDGDSIPALAEIATGVAGELTIEIGGDEALFANVDGVRAGEWLAVGGSFLEANAARLEFWLGAKRCASVSVDQVAAPSLNEQASSPNSGVEFYNPDWLFSLATDGAYALNFFDRAVAPETGINFRFGIGGTFQLKNTTTGLWHTVSAAGADGVAYLQMNATATADDGVNYRIAGAFQILNGTTGLYHTLAVDGLDGSGFFTLNPTGGSDATVNYRILAATLQFKNVTTGLYHTLSADGADGVAYLVLNPMGVA